MEDRNADRVLFLTAAKGEDTGVFVGKDGKLLLLRSAAGKNSFTTNTDAVRVDKMKFAGGLSWQVAQSGASHLENGVLQTVRPQWYW